MTKLGKPSEGVRELLFGRSVQPQTPNGACISGTPNLRTRNALTTNQNCLNLKPKPVAAWLHNSLNYALFCSCVYSLSVRAHAYPCTLLDAGQGRGVVATQDLEAGHLLLCSSPLILSAQPVDPEAADPGSGVSDSSPSLESLLLLNPTTQAVQGPSGSSESMHSKIALQLYSGSDLTASQSSVKSLRELRPPGRPLTLLPQKLQSSAALAQHNPSLSSNQAETRSHSGSGSAAVHNSLQSNDATSRADSDMRFRQIVRYNAYSEPCTDAALAAALGCELQAFAGLYADYAMFNVSACALHIPHAWMSACTCSLLGRIVRCTLQT